MLREVVYGMGIAGVAVGGCLPASGGPAAGGVPAGVSATVLERDVLWKDSGVVLDAMIGRVPSLVVEQTGECPVLMLRGREPAGAAGGPDVYLDGTRAQDTCILQQLRAADVGRIEVYPMGVTARANVTPNPRGVILIYSRRR